jgi:hypothetical protein
MSNTLNKCKWAGKSGKTYEYEIYPIGTTFNQVPGNYIFCKLNAYGQWVPQYIGQSNNLGQRLGDHEKETCAKRNGATHIHAHVNQIEDDRLREEKDLIEYHNPPCNTQHTR